MTQINANNLELVLDVYDDGTIEVAPPGEQVSNGHHRHNNNQHHHHHPVVECCSELSCQPPVEKLFERLPAEENVLEICSSDESEPELVEVACPCRCDGCHGRCHRKVARGGARGRGAAQDEVVLMEANIRVKVPIKRKHFERLVKMARVCQERSL